MDNNPKQQLTPQPPINQQDISETLAADQSAHTATEPKPSKVKKYIAMFFVMFLLTGGAAAYFIWMA